MTIRVRHPGTPPKDRDLGPAHAVLRRDEWVRRLTIDEQIALATKKR